MLARQNNYLTHPSFQLNVFSGLKYCGIYYEVLTGQLIHFYTYTDIQKKRLEIKDLDIKRLCDFYLGQQFEEYFADIQ